MEQLSRGNNFFITDPCYIKEELNISNNYDYSSDELTNCINDNLSDKIKMKSVYVKLENNDEEDIHSDLSDYGVYDNNYFTNSEKSKNNLTGKSDTCTQITIAENLDKNVADVLSAKFTNENLFSELKINSIVPTNKVSDLGKKLQLDDSAIYTILNDSTETIQQENNVIMYDDSSFNEEDFILKISDTSDDKLEDNERLVGKTDNEVNSADSVSEQKGNESSVLDIVKPKVQKINKLMRRSYETRGKRKLNANEVSQSNLFHGSEISSAETIKIAPQKDDIIDDDANGKKAEDILKVSEKKIKLSKFIIRICLVCKKTSECIGEQIKKCQNCKVKLKFKCLFCDKYCKSKPGIYRHIHTYHSARSRISNETEIEINKCIVLSCLECNNTCKVHNKKIIMCQNCKVNMVMVCLICSQHYKTAAEFYLHIRQEHLKHFVKGYNETKKDPPIKKKCLTCGVRFKYSRSWINHNKLCGKEPHLSCKFCPHKTKYKWNLQKHIELKHESEINFETKLKGSSTNLGEKEYIKQKDIYMRRNPRSCKRDLNLQCKICLYQTKEEVSLKKHVIKEHAVEEKNKTYTDKLKKEVDNKKSLDVKKKANYVDLDVEKSRYSLNDEHISAKINKKSKLIESNNAKKSNCDNSPFITTSNKLSILNMSKYFCYKCNETFDDSIQKSEKNCKNCKNELFLKCIKCNRQYKKYQSMIYHLQSKCDPQTYFHCSKCNYTTSVSNLIKKHVVRVHGINYKTNAKKCTKCGKRVRSLIEHTKFCKKELNATRKDNTKSTRNFIKTPHTYQVKKTSTNSEKINQCLRCGKIYKNMKSHMKLCEEEVLFQCGFCTFKTKYKYNLKYHVQNHKLKINNTSKKEHKIKQEVNNKKALQSLHNTANSSIDNLMKSYCSECNKEYIAKKYVWKCRKCNTRLTFRCVQCNLKYRKLEALRMHMKSHTVKNFDCSNCNKKFSLPKSLQMHKNVCMKELCFK